MIAPPPRRSTRPHPLTRRTLLRTAACTAANGAAWLAGAPWVRTARSAGTLGVLMTHHWVPGANKATRALLEEGGARLGVAVRVDFNKAIGSGVVDRFERELLDQQRHDLLDLPSYLTYYLRDELEPLDDLAAELIRRHGPPLPTAEPVGKADGVWRAVPGPYYNSAFPQVSRLDYWQRHAGIDLRAIFPPHERRDAAAVAGWTWDAYLAAARKLHAAGQPVGNPISLWTDANDWLGPLFLAFGSVPADAQGNIAIDSDATRHALEFVARLAEVMPPEVFAWDSLDNNRFLVRGGVSAIFNPPSAWAAAHKQRPDVAAQLWHHDVPAGPAGRFRGCMPHSMGIWRTSRNKAAAQDLIRFLWEPETQRRLQEFTAGYDVPAFPRFNDHPLFRAAGPPEGTLYNYLVRGDETLIHTGYPAPPAMALGIYQNFLLPNLVTRVIKGGQSPDAAIAWAARELESYRG